MTDSLAASAIAEGWSTEGLPGHLVDNVPHTAEVTVYRNAEITPHAPDGICSPYEPTVHQVQLERDGKLLTIKDKLPGWTAGEREGWLDR